ncbi:T9SS type A sorting domain-containing protein [Luteibaculum oceani]|uniref:T9SS type A sorting domain-containing protein n=1 Tax=Luteibaculum oceani TaxID=1294296 RepID=A0A5C6UZB2_9FLAO|nr:T9SS type A sorting domain-containing protein [Luteibaculum oceani]TXC78607.1 T9SS type A sorting domain-containing protein [Luteibaculum oceani]
MNKTLTLFCALFLGAVSTLFSQNDCSNGRFQDPIFNEVLVTPGILYGNAEVTFDTLNSNGTNPYPLYLDVYQPAADLETEERPVIVFAFGGAFVYGARVSPDIVELCNRYAQLGYVCVSIDYRLSDELLVNPSPENATRAVLKGTHDMKAAVRFLYRSAKDLTNPFRIDTNQIYVGGVSAGGFCALHTAYLNDDEIPEILRPEYERSGGLEGRSGNPGYSSKVAGVINLCGALGKKEWLEVGDVPVVSMHGDQDETVPYDEDTVRILDINYPVAGSAAIHRRANEIGVINDFYTFKGAGHVPFVGDAAYMDTTFNFTSAFMYERVCGSVSSGISEKSKARNSQVYPNPSHDFISVANAMELVDLKIISPEGRVVYYTENSILMNKIDISALKNGVYMLVTKEKNGTVNSASFVKK